VLLRQEQPRGVRVGARDVRMDIDRSGHDDLAGRIVRFVRTRARRRIDDAPMAHPHVAHAVAAIQAAGSFYVRVLPVLLGAAALAVAARRRSSTRWPLAGAALVDVLAGTLVFYSVPGQLGLTSSLLPWLLPFSNAFGPRDPMALGEGLVRAVCMLALSLIVQRFARRFDFSSAPRVLGK